MLFCMCLQTSSLHFGEEAYGRFIGTFTGSLVIGSD
jgi:hypothetical protein